MVRPKGKIKVITSQGHVLGVYESRSELQRRTGMKVASISDVCSGKQERYNDFIFRVTDPEAELNQLTLEELQAAKQQAVERGEHEPEEEKANLHG